MTEREQAIRECIEVVGNWSKYPENEYQRGEKKTKIKILDKLQALLQEEEKDESWFAKRILQAGGIKVTQKSAPIEPLELNRRPDGISYYEDIIAEKVNEIIKTINEMRR